jgi:hypothetical protein
MAPFTMNRSRRNPMSVMLCMSMQGGRASGPALPVIHTLTSGCYNPPPASRTPPGRGSTESGRAVVPRADPSTAESGAFGESALPNLWRREGRGGWRQVGLAPRKGGASAEFTARSARPAGLRPLPTGQIRANLQFRLLTDSGEDPFFLFCAEHMTVV